MSYPTIFANLAAGNQPASLFDTMFNIVGQQGNIPCTATGTNAITLTPRTNYYVPAAYTDGQLVTFKAVVSSSGAMTMQLGGLGLVNLYNAAGTQANTGDVVSGTNYMCAYFASLNSGAGGFIIINSLTNLGAAVSQPIQAGFKNLVLTNTTSSTPASQITPTADAVVVQNNSGSTIRILNYAPGVTSTAATGANGLDSGSVAPSTWYYFYAIYNASSATAAGLLSKSATSPTLPSGYTYSALLGAFLTDGSSNLLWILQKGRRAQYVLGTNPTASLLVSHATAGTYSSTSPTLASISIAAYVPPIATSAYFMATTCYNNATNAAILLAPNVNWGGSNNGPAGSNLNAAWPLFYSPAASNSFSLSMEVESTAVGWASSAAGGACGILGWEMALL